MTLRGLLFLLLTLTGLYVAALGGFTVFGVLRPAVVLQESVTPVLEVYGILRQRSENVFQTYQEVRRHVTSEEVPPRSEFDRLWDAVQADGGVSPTVSYAAIPPEVRVQLVRSEEANRELADGLARTLVLARLGGGGRARQSLEVVDSLYQTALYRLGRAEEVGLAHLSERERSLAAAAETAVRGVVAWVLLGLVLLPFVVLLARRRVAVPLGKLDHAASRVASGDLDVELAPERDDELGALMRQFDRMVGVIRRRVAAHGHLASAGELLSGVAHEVQNPLMAIEAVATERLAAPELSGQDLDAWRSAHRQARRARKIVRDLLRFVKEDSLAEPEVFLFQDQLREAVDLVAYAFEVDEIEFEADLPEEPIWVRGYAYRLDKVVVNLLSNALRALRMTEPPRRLRLECRVEEERAVAAVVDSGPGVPWGLQEKLFDPFATHSSGGTGLGLYISKQAMNGMGGGLRYVQEPVRGSRFEAWLPLASPPTEPTEPTEQTEPTEPTEPAERAEPRGAALHGPVAMASPVNPPSPRRQSESVTVLFVEDEESIRRPVCSYLRRRGMRVDEVRDGVEALERIEAGANPDVVVTDLRMPRMDGLALIRALTERFPHVLDRVLVLSGDISVFGEGPPPVPPERIIVKPVDLESLVKQIAEAARAGRDPADEART